jgi:putative phosphoribosyl transferase
VTVRPDRFTNRSQARRLLAWAVKALSLVLALPRGGVPVGYEIARELAATLDILLVRKIGAPGHEEYGIGALVDGASP